MEMVSYFCLGFSRYRDAAAESMVREVNVAESSIKPELMRTLNRH